MKTLEWRIRFNEDVPVTALLDCLEQQPEGPILVAKGHVNFRRTVTVSKALDYLSRLTHPAHARVGSRDLAASRLRGFAITARALFIESESLDMLTQLVVDIPQATICWGSGAPTQSPGSDAGLPHRISERDREVFQTLNGPAQRAGPIVRRVRYA